MIKNYFKIAWRSLWNHKAYSAINIIGLSIGLTACLIVATVVFDELSYDHQWKKADDLYRVLMASNTNKNSDYQATAFAGLGPTLKREFPEVEDACHMSVINERLQLDNNKEGVALRNLNATTSIWKMLDFKVIAGAPFKYVKGYRNLVITEKISRQYFHDQDPIGKTVNILSEYGGPEQCLITGVIKSIPQNSHLKADFITVEEYRLIDSKLPKKGESATFFAQYLLLKHGTNINAFTAKIDKWNKSHPNTAISDFSFRFQPMKDIYLKSGKMYQDVQGNIVTVYIFAAVAVLLLLIACINFINLTISRVFNRAKETGIRKVLGAGKFQLMTRFLSESLLFFIISFTLALILYPLFLKPLEAYMGHPLVINLYDKSFLIIATGMVLVISLVTGLYPAWFLSRPQPMVIMRNKIADGAQLNFLKKALVIGQFVISVTLVIVTFVVHNQLSFMNKKDLGFDKNNLMSISFTDWGTKGSIFKQSIKQLHGVENASITYWYPAIGGFGDMSSDLKLPGQKDRTTVYFIDADFDFVPTLKLRLKSGRSFNPQFATDAINRDSAMSNNKATRNKIKARALLATSYTASLLGIKNNQPITSMEYSGTPVGIIDDFFGESLHNKLQPTIIEAVSDPQYGSMLIRVKPGLEKQTITGISKIYKDLYPEKTFDYNWVSDQIDAQYKNEYKLQQLFTWFSSLIVFLACLGLFGLVSFTAAQRVKEIGIRKVMGASVNNIVALISKDYLGLTAIAVLIASPIAWYLMNKWLQDFAYRIQVQWWVFLLAGAGVLIFALVTISFQSIKAAIANPVKSLRSE